MKRPGRDSATQERATYPPYRRRRRSLVVAALLAFAIGAAAASADAARMLADPMVPTVDASGRPGAPVFAFDLSGSEDEPLQRPVSAAVTDERLYVSDSLAGHVAVFRLSGMPAGTIGADRLEVPVYVAVGSEAGELYVSDRALAAVLAFDTADGSFIETITPSFEETDTPVAWAPIAVEAADDGTLFVSDVAAEHRVLHLERDGTVIGTLPGPDADGMPVEFDFPNAVKSIGERVWVADSNNRRLLEFGEGGALVRSLPLGRLIRGFDVVLAEADGPVYFALTDSFSHQVVLISEVGSEVARLGEPGSGVGELLFPNDVVVHAGITWVVDTGNARVQAWEWGDAARVAAAAVWPGGPSWLGLLSVPFLLAPLGLLTLLRRIRAAISPEAIPMVSICSVDRRWGRVRLLIAPSAGDPPRGDTLPPIETSPISPSDVLMLREVYALEEEQAETLSLALRVRMLVTEDRTLATIARARGIEVYDPAAYAAEFSSAVASHPDPEDSLQDESSS